MNNGAFLQSCDPMKPHELQKCSVVNRKTLFFSIFLLGPQKKYGRRPGTEPWKQRLVAVQIHPLGFVGEWMHIKEHKKKIAYAAIFSILIFVNG